MKILLVGYRDNSHSSAGGYDGIVGLPNADKLMGENVPFGFIPVSTRGKFLNLLFLRLISRWKRERYDVLHFFYGEMLPNWHRNKKHKVVATIHNKVLENDISFIEKLRNADGIITLSSEQARLLNMRYGINAKFIPHGFNKPLFTFEEMEVNKNNINVVVSGKNYRDEKVLYDIITFCLYRRSDVFFHLLGQPQAIKNKLNKFQNVKCYPRLNDDNYFSVFTSCDYSFLPLTFATANNTLLEAEFLGVKSIVPKIAGITDYAASEPLNIYYENESELQKIFLSIEKCQKSEELKEFSEQFLWENIYPQILSFYHSLFVT